MTGCRLGAPEPEHGEGQVLAALRFAQVIPAISVVLSS